MRFTPRLSHCRLLVLAISWLASGLTAGVGAEPTSQVVLQLPYTHQFEFAGVYAAQAQGYFREEGLEVEVRPNPYGKLPLQEMLAGRAQYGIYQAIRVLNDRLEGKPVVVMAAIMQHSPYALAVLRSSGIRNVQDLVGKRVALEKEFRLHEIRRMLLMEGVDPNRVQFITKRWDTNELLDGSADAMAIYSIDSPYDMRLGGQDILVLRPMDYGVDFYGDVLFTNEQELAAHPGRVKAMRRAVLRGWTYALSHQDEMIQWIVGHFPDRPKRVTRERLQFEAGEMARLVNQELIEIGTMNPGRWRVQADILTAADPKLKPASLAGFIYSPDNATGLPQWVRWLGWLAAAVAVLGVLGALEYYRLQRVVQKRTRDLRASEAKYRELFEQVPVPIVVEDFEAVALELEKLRAAGVLDLRAYLLPRRELVQELFLKKRIRAANTLALTKTGFASLEDFDRRTSEVMTEQAMAMYVEELVALWEGRDSLVLEKVYRMKTGQEVHTLLNWQVGRKDGRRDLSQVKLVYIDLTEQKQAERALRESERRYRDLFEHSPVAMMEWDFSRVAGWFAELRQAGVTSLRDYYAARPAEVAGVLPITPLVEANEAALQLLGASSLPELIASMPRIVTPESLAARVELLCQLWEGRNPSMSGEITMRRMDGALRFLRYDRHGGPPGQGALPQLRSLTALVDITDQKQAEQALRESEQRYRELFESAVGGVYRSDLSGRFVSANPAFARLLGYDDPAELVRRSGPGFAASLYVKPTRREEFVAALGEADHVTNFESEVRARDGSTVWISENVHAVRERQSGRLLYFDGFVTDITARRRLESELLRASKLEAVGILAGGIAHDFNNILTVVLGNVTLAEMDTEVTSSVARMLRDAKQATLRARDLTQQLLTFAKGGDPVRAVVALPELLRESAGFAMHGSKVRANYDLPDHLWHANADKGQIGQVVQNLVINAVQAMPQGGTVTLQAANVSLADRQVGTLPAGDYVRLRVADNGVGIPSDHLAKIFDPYFTTKQTGSGLGLATVYSIIRKHQGHIEVESQLGTGTAFTFWLPAAPHDREEEARPAEHPVQLRGRVLFMDDEEPIRSMAGLFFNRLGVDYVLTEEGRETVRIYREALEAGRPFDLVIMDLTVPGGMGGREAMEHLRAIHPAVRAIVSSGYSRDPVLANFRAHGFSGILPKPYSLEQLQQTLRGVFGPGLTQPPF